MVPGFGCSRRHLTGRSELFELFACAPKTTISAAVLLPIAAPETARPARPGPSRQPITEWGLALLDWRWAMLYLRRPIVEQASLDD